MLCWKLRCSCTTSAYRRWIWTELARESSHWESSDKDSFIWWSQWLWWSSKQKGMNSQISGCQKDCSSVANCNPKYDLSWSSWAERSRQNLEENIPDKNHKVNLVWPKFKPHGNKLTTLALTYHQGGKVWQKLLPPLYSLHPKLLVILTFLDI